MAARSPRTTKFRFKSKNHASEPIDARPRSASPSSHRRRHSRRHRHRARNPPHHHHFDPTQSSEPGLGGHRPASPETAFRESLFDALADDEGAAYWEGVYGQPIHTYSRWRASANEEDGAPAINEDGQPVLEMMTDEEYAKYVRGRMWEKSHGYILQQRAEREAARKRQKQERDKEKASRGTRNRSAWDTAFNAAINRSEGKRCVREASSNAWIRYTQRWAELEASNGKLGLGSCSEAASNNTCYTPQIPWPTLSGRACDINQGNVEAFLRNELSTQLSKIPAHTDTSSLLLLIKSERIRWHPDKMQQRYGPLVAEHETMSNVTAVFQIIDSLWVDQRSRMRDTR